MIVVCHYKENLDWLHDIHDDLHVMQKRVPEKNSYQHKYMRPADGFDLIRNIGLESYAWLRYFADNYDDLPERMVMLQGNPFDHCKDVLNLMETERPFLWLSDLVIPTGVGANVDRYIKNHWSYEGYDEAFYEVFPEYVVKSGRWHFGAGAQFLVTRDVVRLRPKGFYERLVKMFEDENSQKSPLSYKMERWWSVVFGV